MKEIFDIALSSTESIEPTNESVAKLLNTLFFEKVNARKISFALERENSHDGGAPDVSRFELQNIVFDAGTKQGTFTAAYDISYFWGCSGISKDQEALKSKWKFCVYADKIRFEGSEYSIDDRSTFEEF